MWRVANALKSTKSSQLLPLEIDIANICENIPFEYGMSGAIGFNYQASKDFIKWSGGLVYHYLPTILMIGNILSLDDKAFEKQKLKYIRQKNSEIKNALILAFGDGKDG